MKRQLVSLLIAFGLAVGGLSAPAVYAQPREDQRQARQEMRAGNVLTPRQIERRVVPRFVRDGYEYLTFEYDSRAMAYRLKFIRDGRIIFVDVDGRSGRILRRR